MKKEMFINARPDECRIAIVADGAMTELYTERTSRLSRVGNIYKCRVTNVEASIQAAFVDFGTEKNGFLHISDVHPTHFPGDDNAPEAVGRKRARKERPPIQQCLRRGQELIVQVTKEGVGTKGSTLTTYLSIPGRYLVLMPGMHRLGVSRKIEDEEVRVKARNVLQELSPPPDMGFIVRTAGLDRPKQDLQRDLNYLVRLWKSVDSRAKTARTPSELYQESDLVIRTIRDVYNSDIKRIICDDETVACKVKEFLQLIMPRSAGPVELYEGEVSLFHAFGLEQELEEMNSPRAPLASGGSIVIDQTEALVAIDVNSGRFRDTDNAETTALRINTEAVYEVSRQLRLRDLGGVIVIDFIDMMVEKNRRTIEKLLRDEVKKDRARTKILRISRFGIIEMTRQRIRPSLVSNIFRPCQVCGGIGRVKSAESQALSAMRNLSLAASDDRIARIELTVCAKVADHILNSLRGDIVAMEQRTGSRILIHADANLPPDQMRIACTDGRGSQIQWDVAAALKQRPKKVPSREITKADVDEFRKRTPALDLVEVVEETPPEQPAKTKSRGRRRRKSGAAEPVAEPQAQPQPQAAEGETPEAEKAPGKKKRSRRRRRKGAAAEGAAPPAESEIRRGGQAPAEGAEATEEARPAEAEATLAEGETPTRKKRKRRRSRRKPSAEQAEGAAEKADKPPVEAETAPPAESEIRRGGQPKPQPPPQAREEAREDGPPVEAEKPAKKRRRRTRRRPSAKPAEGVKEEADKPSAEPAHQAEAKENPEQQAMPAPQKRTARRRTRKPAAKAANSAEAAPTDKADEGAAGAEA